MILLLLLLVSPLAAQFLWTADPDPGGSVRNPGVTPDEGAVHFYSITAQDKDSYNTQLEGDPSVRLFWDDSVAPPSATDRLGWTQSNYNSQDGTREFTFTVKARAWDFSPNDFSVDYYAAGDVRGQFDPRRDKEANGQDRRTPLGQTVILKKKRGFIIGKVTDADGNPASAWIWIQTAPNDMPTDFPEIQVPTDESGDYETIMFANVCEVACGREYPTAERTALVTVPRDGIVTQNFQLP